MVYFILLILEPKNLFLEVRNDRGNLINTELIKSAIVINVGLTIDHHKILILFNLLLQKSCILHLILQGLLINLKQIYAL